MNPPALAELLRRQPLAITGLGAFTAAGRTVPELWHQAQVGQATAGWLPFKRPAGAPPFAGCVAPPVPLDHPPLRRTRKMDRSVQLAVAAAVQAMADARLAPDAAFAPRLGIIAGISRGPVTQWVEAAHQAERGRGLPSLAPNSSVACLSGALALTFQAQGPCLTVSAACASSAAAIGLAAQQILAGAADFMLAGGAEAPLHPAVLEPLATAGLLGRHTEAPHVCRPFDTTRNGTVLGEGAAFVVLETLASARRRGVPVHAVLAGWAIGSDVNSRTGFNEAGEGLARVIAEALRTAGMAPGEIGYINAHGTGTRMNDRYEARVLARLIESHPGPVLCSSTKPVTGHCLGAAAAIEAVISILALKHQCAPPSANCAHPDPACRLPLVTGPARPFQASAVLSTSCGFWGNHAALLFHSPFAKS